MIFYRQFLVFMTFSVNQLCAQQLDPKNFVHYTTENGMSHNSVTGLAQDATGYVWIATSSGLNRFNGREFVQFHSSKDSTSLAAEDILSLNWLDSDRLAVSTAGLHILNTRTGSTRNLFVPYRRLQYQYKFNMLIRAVGDTAGNTYILSRSGFYHFNKNGNLIYRFDYYSEKEVLTEHFFFGEQLLELDSKRLLIVSSTHLYVYNKEKKNFKKLETADCPLLAEFAYEPAYFFFQQKRGKLFILNAKGDSLIYADIADNKKVVSRLPFNLIKPELGWRSRLMPVSDTVFYLTGHNTGFFKLHFNPESGSVTCDARKYFAAFQCTSLLNDKDDHLWIGTDKGLFREDPARLRVQIAEIPPHVEQVFPNVALCEVFASAGTIYVGTRNFGNLLLYNKRNLQFIRDLSFEPQRKKTGQSLNIFSIIEADSATLLLATDGPLFLVNKTATKASILHPPQWSRGDWSADLYKDSKGVIWISSYHVYRYQHRLRTFSPILENIQLSSQIIQPEAIREDGAGNVWFAGHGLSRYNVSLQRFDLRLDSFPFIKMPDKQVRAVVIDKSRNIIWFNSPNNGLLSYNIGTSKFQHFTTSDGLPDNTIAALIIVNNQLWIAGAASGVACMDLNTLQITGFGKEDGFPDMPVLGRAAFFYDSALQQLYLPFSQAIARFHPDQLLRKKSPPRVFIEELKMGGKKALFLPEQLITTSWEANQVRITIDAINFSDAINQRFAYRIVKDTSTPWIDLGSQPSFSISNLSPGIHHIQVKVYSINSRWAEQVKEISIEVLPPLWLKSWFLTLLVALFITLLYLFIEWRTGLARKKEMEKTHIEKLKADHYKNQFELEQISNYFSSSLAGKKTEDDVLWDVAAHLIGQMNYEECIIYRWNETKTRMVQKAAFGPKGKPEIISAEVFEVEPGQGIVGHVINTKQPILVNDTRLDNRYRVDDQFRLSEVAIPIIHNDELLGVIDSENSQLGYFSEQDIKILTTIATLIGNKLMQLQSEQSLEAKQQELAGINEKLAEARLSALQAQMNPHFIFNALNSIKRMILDNDNEKASRYLSKFALMIRLTLEHSKDVFVTLDENIEYLKAYLDMEQLRFGDSFTYNFYIDANVDTAETVLPSMMIQPLVENAIWHGLMYVKSDKKISITFNQVQHKVWCIVEDNGIGIRESKKLKDEHRPLHRSLGLENLQKRIKIMNEKYKTACSLDVTDLSDEDMNRSGTRAVLQFNLINV